MKKTAIRMAPQLQDQIAQLSLVPSRRHPAVGTNSMQSSSRKGKALPAGQTERSLSRTTFNLPFAARATERGEQILQAVLEGSQQCMLFSAISGFPSSHRRWHGPEHGHQGSVRIFAVSQYMIEGDAHGLVIHIQGHRVSCDLFHRCRCCGWNPAVMVGVAQHGIAVVVIHMTADAVADFRSERVGSHGNR